MPDEKHPTPAERDKPIKIDLDPETTLRGLLKVDPESEPTDRALLRARELFLADSTDKRENEIETLIPGLVEVGYVEVDEQLGAWSLTQRGRDRADLLEGDEDSELRHDAE